MAFCGRVRERREKRSGRGGGMPFLFMPRSEGGAFKRYSKERGRKEKERDELKGKEKEGSFEDASFPGRGGGREGGREEGSAGLT